MRAFFKKKIITWAAVAIVAVGLIWYFVSGKKAPVNLITVARGDIAEEVIVTGNTSPISNTDLAFQASGRIAAVHVAVGDMVTAGEPLAELDASELQAQLAQAQASAQAAQAKLDGLKAGTRPEDITITRTNIAKAEQDLTNDYDGVPATLADAYAKASDAVRNQVSALFTNADTPTPQLTFTVTDSQAQINAQSDRVLAGDDLDAWQNELAALTSSTSTSTDALDAAVMHANSHLASVVTLLNDLMNALASAPGLNTSTLTAYKTSVTAAESEVSAAVTNVDKASQTIASQKIVVKQNEDQLNLQLAGSTSQDIEAQQAAVAQAQANVQSVQAQINQTVIHSPINGTVTREDAKVGQIASPGATLISVISASNLEIDVNVPEVDIGKVNIGDPVSITLDAFPGETFMGKVTKIDPAQTIVNGVVDFKVTIDFDKPDPRFKSGLTANLQIETKKDTGVLIVPEAAVLQNDSGTFAVEYKNGANIQVPVTLGIRDQSGNVEIASGVSEGDKLVNIGLKTQ
ncbi:MAG TPA: efflux RND transporter periplasmic adaptor subunit [Candidatus Paceibacterota bacterium]|nr:efflux RND transporter periplasmic adaptor subunit [Candidatus Paceibacterota bacterium]